ncbi:glycosyltransferase family 39 protein [Candidatus Bathyarchaeota archaeon]|nr:glycosyltransferase family 39 protein [Candidatus Bathyarchaeota archaeon]
MQALSWIEKNKLILILLICVLGFFLRFNNLGGESYWFDETMSLYFSQQDLGAIINPPSYEAHIPPLYYLMLHFWIGLFGTSEFAVRSLSAIFGVLSIFALYKLGKTLFNVKIAVYSSFILAISIFQIYFSQEARMYSLLMLTTLLSIFFFVKSLNENRKRYWVSYIIASILMLYTHAYGIFIIILQFFCLLIYYRHEKGVFKKGFTALSLITAGFFPWLIKLLDVTPYVLEGSSAIGWIPQPDIILIIGTITVFCNSSVVSILVFGYSLRSIFTLNNLKKRFANSSSLENLKRIKACVFNSSNFSITFCFMWIGIPIILALLISFIFQPIYLPKYLILVSPAFYLLVSKGLANKNRKLRYILLLILLIDSAVIAYSYYTNPNKEQWREAAFYVQEHETVGDIIIVNAPWLKLSFEQYYTGSNVIVGVQTTDQLSEALLTNEHDKLWLILSHDNVADPDGEVKTRLNDSHQLNEESEFVSQDILNSISILGYPITGDSSVIKIYYYSKQP